MPKANINKESSSANYSTDTVRVYLQEISKIPLLTPEQEISLGTQVRAMMTLIEKKEIREKELQRQLTFTEWATLVEMSGAELNRVVRLGQRAKKKMIEANLRLVVTVATHYQKRGLDLLDLIQEGNLGLQRGVEKFDPTREYKLSTYSYWWIRQAIKQALNKQSRTIRLPVHVTEKINRIKRTHQELSQSLGRNATLAEVACKLNLRIDLIQEYLSMARRSISLNIETKDNRNFDLLESLEDKRFSGENHLNRQFLQQELYELMLELSPQQRQILLLRFGFDGEKELSLAQIAQKMKLSHEKIRQMERRALMVLRRKRGKIREYFFIN